MTTITIARLDGQVGDIGVNGRTVASMFGTGANAGCEIVVRREMADIGRDREAMCALAASLNEGRSAMLVEPAAHLGVSVMCGLTERADDRLHAAVVATDRDGANVANHRRTHFFGTPRCGCRQIVSLDCGDPEIRAITDLYLQSRLLEVRALQLFFHE